MIMCIQYVAILGYNFYDLIQETEGQVGIIVIEKPKRGMLMLPNVTVRNKGRKKSYHTFHHAMKETFIFSKSPRLWRSEAEKVQQAE